MIFLEYYIEYYLINYKIDIIDFIGLLFFFFLDFIFNIVIVRGFGVLRFFLYKRYIEVCLNCSE